MDQYVITLILTRIYLVENLNLMINDNALNLLSKIIWNVFELRVFFLDQEPCISRPYRILCDHSLLLLKLERHFWFLLTCVGKRKKVWVNFKRKVLYFRSSNHTSGEIRPATKSDIEVKTVSVTSVVEWHRCKIFGFCSTCSLKTRELTFAHPLLTCTWILKN